MSDWTPEMERRFWELIQAGYSYEQAKLRAMEGR